MIEPSCRGSLARLLRAATLLSATVVIGCTAALVHFTHWVWAWVPGAVAATAWAGVLAVEFAMMSASSRRRAEPSPGRAELLGAWWGETTRSAAVFGWQQPFRSTRFPDVCSADGEDRTGVLLVHGFLCNRGFWNAWLERLERRSTPFIAVNLEPVFGSIEHYIPIIEAAIARLERATGRPPIAVAHSMGGLALRRWWAEPGNLDRLDHAITLGSPHRGTALAHWGCWPNSREMKRGSAFMASLDAREPRAVRARLTCFWSDCDNIVFPVDSATLEGASNRPLAGRGHVDMAWHPAPLQNLLALLETRGARAAS